MAELLRRNPITCLFLAGGLLGALLVSLDPYGGLWRFLLFPDFRSPAGPPPGEYWRWVTPIFLHFGAMHTAFNGLMLWLFGIPLESMRGGPRLAFLLLAAGVFSNYCQYIVSGSNLFGGLSGALYGLGGYIWVWNMLLPARAVPVPPALIGLLFISLALGLLGILDFIVGGRVANTAHLAGLGAGALLGALDALGWGAEEGRR